MILFHDFRTYAYFALQVTSGFPFTHRIKISTITTISNDVLQMTQESGTF